MKNTSKVRMIILAVVALLLQTAQASVLFENTILFNFQASGPVSLMSGQNASVCATNLDNSPVSILIALLQVDTGNLLGTKQQVIPAGGGTCLNFVRTVQSQQPQGNVVALVVPNASVTQLGVIVQVGPGGGGCIAASLQIQATTVNNIPGQTFLYVPMKDLRETGRSDN